MKIALLTCTTWDGLFEKEQALAQQIQQAHRHLHPHLHLQVDTLAWDDASVDWSGYDYLVFRTTWDYFQKPQAFAAWLEKIQNLGVKTLNPIHTIRRNLHKFYLRDLQNQGIDIIPTVFLAKNSVLDLGVLQQHDWQQAIIKPAISAGSHQTQWFGMAECATIAAQYAPLLQEENLLLQPFLPEVQTQGEISILFFNGQYSHAIVKTPKAGDFRVQIQYGGNYQIYQPDPDLVRTAQRIVNTFDSDLLYARVDGIFQNGVFLLMELELIEPDLYFTTHPDAQPHFIAALLARLTPA
jgi:glutathione synthase/RimK-type ligase-like ATP-grasp enzyme